MNLSESYKRKLQELAGIDVPNFSKEEYQQQLKKLGIENFEDLIGKTVYYVKKVYGKHKVIKWIPERGEYLLFTSGQRVLANPFNIIEVLNDEPIENDAELKWVIENLCAEEIPQKIDIKNKFVNEKGDLTVVFDIITKDSKSMFYGQRVDVEVSYKDVVLDFMINKNDKLTTHLKGEGEQKIIKSSDGESVGQKWDAHAPFISPNYNTNDVDRVYMKKIIERIILSLI